MPTPAALAYLNKTKISSSQPALPCTTPSSSPLSTTRTFKLLSTKPLQNLKLQNTNTSSPIPMAPPTTPPAQVASKFLTRVKNRLVSNSNLCYSWTCQNTHGSQIQSHPPSRPQPTIPRHPASEQSAIPYLCTWYCPSFPVRLASCRPRQSFWRSSSRSPARSSPSSSRFPRSPPPSSDHRQPPSSCACPDRDPTKLDHCRCHPLHNISSGSGHPRRRICCPSAVLTHCLGSKTTSGLGLCDRGRASCHQASTQVEMKPCIAGQYYPVSSTVTSIC